MADDMRVHVPPRTCSRITMRTNIWATEPQIISAAHAVSKGSLLSTHCCSYRVSKLVSVLKARERVLITTRTLCVATWDEPNGSTPRRVNTRDSFGLHTWHWVWWHRGAC